MSFPANFGGAPKEELHHHFRNICIEFIKIVKTSKDLGALELQMDRFKNVSSQINWEHKPTISHKEKGTRALNKVLKEFTRYIQALQNNQKADSKDLILSLENAGNLLYSLHVD